MNFYENIQNGINYIELNLEREIALESVADAACMSLPSLYRLFHAFTGHTVKGYIRSRRLSKAALELEKSSETILYLAIKYGFKSHAAFTRAFRKQIGINPAAFRSDPIDYKFERINIMDKYFEILEENLVKKYPKIKVLKELAPIKVVSYCYVGKEPEHHAWTYLMDWLEASGLKNEMAKYRFFGFNNPSPTEPGQTEYGYEVWVTFEDGMEVTDPNLKVKTFEGGLYAIRNISGDPAVEMGPAWHELTSWLEESPYALAEHQWLEEHIDFDAETNFPASFDLYMPIKKKV